jgi:hypothetical protein
MPRQLPDVPTTPTTQDQQDVFAGALTPSDYAACYVLSHAPWSLTVVGQTDTSAMGTPSRCTNDSQYLVMADALVKVNDMLQPGAPAKEAHRMARTLFLLLLLLVGAGQHTARAWHSDKLVCILKQSYLIQCFACCCSTAGSHSYCMHHKPCGCLGAQLLLAPQVLWLLASPPLTPPLPPSPHSLTSTK